MTHVITVISSRLSTVNIRQICINLVKHLSDRLCKMDEVLERRAWTGLNLEILYVVP